MTIGSIGYVTAQEGRILISPSAVLRKVEELDRQNAVLQTAFGDYTTAILNQYDEAFIASWAAYLGRWATFSAELRDSYMARWTSGNVALLEDFINESNTFEARLRAMPEVLPAGVLSTREEAERAAGSGLPAWGWTLIALGAVGVGAYALYTLSRVMREGRLIAETAQPSMAGLGAPKRVYDLDGPSTYNLEIDS